MKTNYWVILIFGFIGSSVTGSLYSREGHAGAGGRGHAGAGGQTHAAPSGHANSGGGQQPGGNGGGGSQAPAGGGQPHSHRGGHSSFNNSAMSNQPNLGGQQHSVGGSPQPGPNPGFTSSLQPSFTPNHSGGSPAILGSNQGTSANVGHHRGTAGPTWQGRASVGPTNATLGSGTLNPGGNSVRSEHGNNHSPMVNQHKPSGYQPGDSRSSQNGMNGGVTNGQQPASTAASIAASHSQFSHHAPHGNRPRTTGQQAGQPAAPAQTSGVGLREHPGIGQPLRSGTGDDNGHLRNNTPGNAGVASRHDHEDHSAHHHGQWNRGPGNHHGNGHGGGSSPTSVVSSVSFYEGYGNGNIGSQYYYSQPLYWGFGSIGFDSLAYGSGYLGYTNPYFNNVGWMGNGFDYAQPIMVNQPVAVVAPQPGFTTPLTQPVAPAVPSERLPNTTPGESQHQAFLNSAVAAFKQDDFDTALEFANRAIEQFPGDAVFHEFRALTLFAKGDYQQAAATMHAVLAVSQGWDWATLISVYSHVDVYTKQLRALERSAKQNPDDGATRFLLAYHYLTGGYPDAAARMLRRVVALVPNDRVASDLLKSLQPSEKPGQPDLTPLPLPQPPPEEGLSAKSPALDGSQIVGDWKATRPDGSAFALKLTTDNAFIWSFTPKQQSTQSFEGTYTLAGNVITLKRNGSGSLIATIDMNKESRFQFKLVGAPKEDPGLDFSNGNPEDENRVKKQ